APDVLHIHNLLNLSFDLPRMAKARGIATIATLHDYTLVCPSGGQRVHVAESHVCQSIDADRCARCFQESPFAQQMRAGRVTQGAAGRAIARAGRIVYRLVPTLAATALHALDAPEVDATAIRRRLAYARHVFTAIDWFVAPSRFMADE